MAADDEIDDRRQKGLWRTSQVVTTRKRSCLEVGQYIMQLMKMKADMIFSIVSFNDGIYHNIEFTTPEYRFMFEQHVDYKSSIVCNYLRLKQPKTKSILCTHVPGSYNDERLRLQLFGNQKPAIVSMVTERCKDPVTQAPLWATGRRWVNVKASDFDALKNVPTTIKIAKDWKITVHMAKSRAAKCSLCKKQGHTKQQCKSSPAPGSSPGNTAEPQLPATMESDAPSVAGASASNKRRPSPTNSAASSTSTQVSKRPHQQLDSTIQSESSNDSIFTTPPPEQLSRRRKQSLAEYSPDIDLTLLQQSDTAEKVEQRSQTIVTQMMNTPKGEFAKAFRNWLRLKLTNLEMDITTGKITLTEQQQQEEINNFKSNIDLSKDGKPPKELSKKFIQFLQTADQAALSSVIIRKRK